MSSSVVGTADFTSTSSSPYDSDDEESELRSEEESSDVDSDLEQLYESFDFETSVSQVSAGDPITSNNLPAGADQTPLYPNAELTSFQSHLLLFQYGLRHSLTTKAFTELLQLLTVHLPRGAKVPKSVHHLKRFFWRLTQNLTLLGIISVVTVKDRSPLVIAYAVEPVVTVDLRQCLFLSPWDPS